jgi:hypothetical protein
MVEALRLLATTATSKEYKVYNMTISGDTGFDNPANQIDVGADLKALYGTSTDVPANAGFIYSDNDVQIRFNSESNDSFTFDVSEFGNVYTINRGDLLIYSIYFANQIPSGSATEATIQVFLSGAPID